MLAVRADVRAPHPPPSFEPIPHMQAFNLHRTRWRRVLRRLAASAVAILVLAAGAATWVYVASERRLQHDYALDVTLPVPHPALREQGRRLARSRGCADCHGDDFGGKVIADAMPFARLVGGDLTKMPPGHADRGVHERMYRALHHGVDLDSRPLLMMPSKEFASLSEREIAALSVYFAGLPPVERRLPDSALGPLGRALLVAGKLDGFLSAEAIDHSAAAIAEPPPLGTIEYGRHAAQLCSGCHRADFGGGRMSHGGPELPPASNLTPHANGLAAWSERDFIRAMRTGLRPDGSAIDGNAMPWRAVGQASDLELQSIWRFLRTLPPIAARDIDAARQVNAR